MIDRRHFLLTAVAFSQQAFSQGGPYPDRPIRFIVPNPPGGPSDIVARFLAESMRGTLGQSIVVENRPGATGLIGTSAVASANPDGYTILVTSRTNHVLAPLVQRQTQVDPARDLIPIGLVLRAVGMLATHSEAPFKTLPEMFAFAKANPKKLFYGSAGIGATNHIAIEQLKTITGLSIEHVPYRGSGPLINGLMSGEVSLALLDFSSAQSGVQAKRLVPLAQTASRRLPSLRQVPTLLELGYKDYDPSFWIGLAAPKGVPSEVVDLLNKAMNVALSETQMKARAQVNGWELVGGKPEMLTETVVQDQRDYPELIKRLDIRAN